MIKIILLGLTLFLLSCNNGDKTSNSETLKQSNNETFPIKELIIGNGEEEGWGADIRLSIISIKETDTSRVFITTSSYEGKKLGFSVSVPKAKEDNGGFESGIILKSIGSESDNLLLTLSNLYKQKEDTTLRFTEAVSLTYVNLDEFAKSLGAKDRKEYKTENQYKLFYEGINEGEYAEVYLNINQTEHWIELKEKDEEYRPIIIKFLKR
jgi:hypothetical protein